MKTLLLLRHAKSDWANPGLDDFDRPLNARGRKAATRMARFIRSEDLSPDLVWCSTAARARETWSLMAPTLSDEAEVVSRDDLYLASRERLLAVARTAPDHAQRLMIVAHNPGLHDLAVSLATTSRDQAELIQLVGGLPTSALAIVVFCVDVWAGISNGELLQFVRPKQLQHRIHPDATRA
tara:strand:- start:441 stop:983 length:543 start_codon:yes stop_codon:yes gene_type:complete